MVKISAPGNVFLLGEHSVVYERPALLASIGRRTYISGRKISGDGVTVKSDGYGTIESDFRDISKRVYRTQNSYTDPMDPIIDLIGSFNSIKEIETGFEAKIESDIPKDSGGQSSSTAVLASFFDFLCEIYGVSIKKDEYFPYLYPLQVKIHGGAASGSEFASSILGGYNRVVKTPDGSKPIEFKNLGNPELDLVIGDTGIEAKTDKTVGHVRQSWEKNKEIYESHFNSIRDLVERAEEAIGNQDLQELGGLMDENHRILRDMGVSHRKLDRLVSAAREAGAYGAKLSGGGGGGIMVALCDETNKRDIKQAIEEAGGDGCITEVGVDGVRKEV